MCGKSDEKVPFYGELCVECAKSKIETLPTVRISVCTKCNSLLDKARKRKNSKPEEEIFRILKMRQKNPSLNAEKTEISYDTPTGRVTQPVLIIIGKSICVDCGRTGSQYFEAIIQLRGHKGKIERMLDMISRKLEEKTFIPKTVELKEGIDIYVGSRNEAIAALNAFQLSFLRTEKLAGEKNGKRLYRTTLLVRL
ncbi:NMD3 family protein [uncultured archaeon]|nr:NMD3 family protein [uncultured archaeon]